MYIYNEAQLCPSVNHNQEANEPLKQNSAHLTALVIHCI